jgi:5-methyltetrahydrofolate--homocysteine methyltransferase
MTDAILAELSEGLISGKADNVKELAERALKEGVSAKEILDEGLVKGMQVVGEKFECNEFYLPELLVAARAMYSGLEVIKPHLTAEEAGGRGTVVIGTVKGDLHDIGKNVSAMMFEGAGFQVVDLGADVPPEKFLEEVRKHSPCIVGMSALLTTTMIHMRETIVALQEANLRDKVRVIIGGAPVTQEFADEIGADAFAIDASTGVKKALALISAG